MYMADEKQIICKHCKEPIIKGVKKCPHCQSDLRSFFSKHPILTLLLFIIFVPMVIAALSDNSSTTTPTTTNAPVKSKNIVKPAAAKDPIAQIEQAVATVGKFEVTVWDTKGNPADSKTNPPYEIIVNGSMDKTKDCFYAKDSLVKVMAAIYGNAGIKDKVARVLFTVPYNLRASLGYNDAKDLNWQETMPTNFWKTTLQYKSREDETGDLKNRTWGVDIGNCE